MNTMTPAPRSWIGSAFVRLGALLVPNRYALFLIGLLLYLQLTDSIVEVTKGVWRMEIPLLLYAYFCMNALVKPSRWQGLIAAVPLLTLYVMHDFYYLRFFRVLKLIEVTQIKELLVVAGPTVNVILATITLGLLYLIGRFFQVTRRGAVVTLPLLAILMGPFVYPYGFVKLYSNFSIEVIHYSGIVNVEYNGRVATALYNEAKRRDTMNNIAKYRDIDKLSMRLTTELIQRANGKNVHLIVLESFVDPTLFKSVPAAAQAPHPEFSNLTEKSKGLSVSPVFGGYTSQAEFEFLCGVPAFQEFDEIEFNVLSGAETYCLPRILQEMGYQSIASNGYKPDFFNTIPSYQGIGFGAYYFPKEYTPTMSTYLSKGPYEDNKYLFDGDMLEQNLTFVKAKLEEKKPFFNYVLTVYGHFPFDYGSRMGGPPVIKVPDMSETMERVFNQHYYRTQAIAHYLKQLLALDPTALIILVSDHLPPLPGGTKTYDTLGYLQELPDRIHTNRLLVFRAGQPEPHPQFTHFNIYRLILDFVTNHAYCQHHTCVFDQPVNKETLRDDYRIIMGLGSR